MGIQWATLQPCKYYSRFKWHHFLFALSKTTFCYSYFRCDASQDGSALWIILFSRVDSFHSPKVTLYTCIFELGPNIWHWKIPTLQAFFFIQVMALKVVMIRRWMPIPCSLKGCTLSQKKTFVFCRNESIFGFYAESSTCFGNWPKI